MINYHYEIIIQQDFLEEHTIYIAEVRANSDVILVTDGHSSMELAKTAAIYFIDGIKFERGES